ncbi:ATP-binding protein [Schleiferilactobacillus harbinensis]|uniref:ATP-binding protein n=1 Tax=Schleiferilactobacillus harbinensis TaxID=304207 RepID=A0ABU7T3B6_9LACO
MLTRDDPQPLPNESNTIEYKETFNEKIKKEIAAFLNGEEVGYIYLGISDRTRLIVQDFSDSERHKIEEQVSRWISSSLYYPSPIGLVRVHTEASILNIEVKPGDNKPYSLDERVYQRNNSESVKASPETVNRMLRNQSLDSFDKSEALDQDLSFTYLKTLFSRAHIAFKPQALGFQTSSGAYMNTAFLMSDQNTNVVKIAVFAGTTVQQFKDRKEISGPLPKQIDDVLAYLYLNNPLSSTITGRGQRDDQQGYPTIALREAVVNAVTHRSYFSKSPVQIEIFDDRMTIMSPGPLPGGLNTEAIMSGQTLPRNPNVVAILYRLEYIENYGTGIRRIFDSYQGEESQPHLLAREDFVKMTLPNLNYVPAKKSDVPSFINVVSTDESGSVTVLVGEQGHIIEYLKTHNHITRRETEELLNVKASQANNYLREMVAQGVLKRLGAGPSSRYGLARQILNQ